MTPFVVCLFSFLSVVRKATHEKYISHTADIDLPHVSLPLSQYNHRCVTPEKGNMLLKKEKEKGRDRRKGEKTEETFQLC